MSVDSTSNPSGRSQLLKWIERNNISRAEASVRFGVSPTLMTRWLNGERRPGYQKLLLLQDETGIPVDSWPSQVNDMLSRAELEEAVAEISTSMTRVIEQIEVARDEVDGVKASLQAAGHVHRAYNFDQIAAVLAALPAQRDEIMRIVEDMQIRLADLCSRDLDRESFGDMPPP